MKNILLTVVLALSGSNAWAATIKSAKLDGAKKNILVDVVHGGGCGYHEYKLQMGMCLESNPVQCSAELIHTTDDHCEAILYQTAVFNLKEYGLDDEYFRGGSLKIVGEKDWETGKRTSATVRLP